MLEVVGVPEDRRERVRLSDRKWVVIDYTNGIASGLPRDPNQKQAWSEAWASYQGSMRPNPDELRRMLAPFVQFEAWREALMQYYEHYWRTGTHRRPHIWAKRDEWHDWTKDGTWPAS